MALLFQDDFNRADGTIVGNSWTQTGDGSSFASGISSNRLYISGNFNGAARVYHSQGGTLDQIAYSLVKFTPSGVGTNDQFRFLLNSDGSGQDKGFGLYINTNGNEIKIIDANSLSGVKASGSFTFSSSESYWLKLVPTTNGMDVYIWDTDNSEPGTPTLSFDNGSPFTPSSSGSNVLLNYANNTDINIRTNYFDDILIESAPPRKHRNPAETSPTQLLTQTNKLIT